MECVLCHCDNPERGHLCDKCFRIMSPFSEIKNMDRIEVRETGDMKSLDPYFFDHIKRIRCHRNSLDKMYKKLLKRHVKKLNFSIDTFISKDQLEKLMCCPMCYYCGSTNSKIGVDRLNDDIGYEVDNIVPCCKACNFMKNELSCQEFIKHVNILDC